MLGTICRHQGLYDDAETLYMRALGLQEANARTTEHEDLVASVSNLGLLYLAKGQRERAEHFLKRALDLIENWIARDHPSVMTHLDNLANLYRMQGRYAEAEPLYERALAILAETFRQQNKYAKAEPLFQRVISIKNREFKRRAFGQDHLHKLHSIQDQSLFSMTGLASIFVSQCEYFRAEPLYRRVLSIRDNGLRPEQPELAVSLSNLASLYVHMGQYDKAEPLFTRAIAIFENSPGLRHPSLSTSIEGLAILYRKTGREQLAQEFQQRADFIRAITR
jgi:tetratricopeptide (TPR) repeat protein